MQKSSSSTTHTNVGFSIKHMMISNVKGNFNTYAGEIDFDVDKKLFNKLSAKIDASSIDTGIAKRDDHLRSADFFDVENHPKLTFTGKSFSKINENNYELVGDLNIKDITKEVKLPVEFSGLMQDPWGNTKVGLNIEGQINRKDWGLNWNSALETGGVLVGEEVKLIIDLQLVKS